MIFFVIEFFLNSFLCVFILFHNASNLFKVCFVFVFQVGGGTTTNVWMLTTLNLTEIWLSADTNNTFGP